MDPKATVRPDQPGRALDFVQLGIQEYVTGRHAAFCGFEVVAAQMFHHGMELILKGQLLTPAFNAADLCIQRARAEAEHLLDTEVRGHFDEIRLDPVAVAACLAPYSARVKEVADRYAHSLPRLWEEFKREVKNARLASHDGLITRLDQWRDQRYPQHVRSRPNAFAMGARVTIAGGQLANRYRVDRDEVDLLVADVLRAMHLDGAVRAAMHGRSDGARTYRRENRNPLST